MMDETQFGELVMSLKQAAAHARGEEVPGLVVHAPRVAADLDVAAIRRRTGASQARFARSIGIAVSTLLDRNPRVVQELLGEAA